MKNHEDKCREETDTVSEKETGDQCQEEECHCGVCGQLYEDHTHEEELWIACDACCEWYHAVCVHIDCENVPERFSFQRD